MGWIHDEIGRAVGLPACWEIPLDAIGATGLGLATSAQAVQEAGYLQLAGARWPCRGSGRSAGTPPGSWSSGAVLVAASDSAGRWSTRQAWTWPPWRPARPVVGVPASPAAYPSPATTCWGWTASCWSRPPVPRCSPPPTPTRSEPGDPGRPTSRPPPRLSSCSLARDVGSADIHRQRRRGHRRAVEHRGDTQAHALALVRRRSAPTPAWCWARSARTSILRGRRPRSWPAPASPTTGYHRPMVNGPVHTLDSRVEKEAPYMRPSTQELVALADERDGPCVSINLPTHGPGGEQQDPIRLQNLLREAEHRLAGRLRHSRTKDLLAQALRLASDAAFGGGGRRRPGTVPGRRRPPPAAAALPPARAGRGGDRFHVKPLLPLLWGWPVLPAGAQPAPGAAVRGRPGRPARAGAARRPRRAGRGDAAGGPRGAAPATPDRPGAARRPAGGSTPWPWRGGRRRQGPHPALLPRRRPGSGALGNGRAPLVLAAVDYLRPLYRAASSYPQILEQGLSGNPDHLGAHDLHRRAWTLVGHQFRSDQQAVAVRCRALERRGRATSDLRRIVPAAVGRPGRVAAGPHGRRAMGQRGPGDRRGPAPSALASR